MHFGPLVRILGFTFAVTPLAAVGGAVPETEILIVGAPALTPSPSLDAYSVSRIDARVLELSASPRLDDALREVPGFTLFRRTSSRVAHPTIQGVSLRGIGPNGAGRTLVMVDGVPANDPFGGWVYWTDIPAASVERVTIIRGGGAGPWGNAAIAGTVRVETRAPEGDGMRADVALGSRNSIDANLGAWATMGAFTIDLDAHRSTSDGYHLLRAEDRGAVDQSAEHDATRARLGLTWRGDGGLAARLTVGFHDEERNNGTPLAVNDTRSTNATLRVAQEDADGSGWEAALYLLDRTFVNQFTSVDSERMGEVPALFQYDVPAKAYGGNALVRRVIGEGVLEVGADIRLVEGATNELFLLQDGIFRRDRHAGGKQILAGAFIEYTHAISERTALTGGMRLDHLRDRAGVRQERNLDTDVLLVDETFDSRSHTVVNGRLGMTHDVTPDLRGRLVAYSGFRQPTINELYRPFRVRNDITEANPGLRPERLYGAELGFTWALDPALTFDITGFYTRLENGVANVLVTDQPGLNPEFGVFLPPGGTLSQRRNLDVMRTAGIEADLAWTPVTALTVDARYLWTTAKVVRVADDPALEGRRTPQVPRHQGSVALTWSPVEDVRARASVRGETAQYDDALNTRRLGGYVTADLFAGWTVRPGVELYGAVENLFDRTVVVALAADGLETIGTPRLFRAGVRAAF